jgi:hypothetical protein
MARRRLGEFQELWCNWTAADADLMENKSVGGELQGKGKGSKIWERDGRNEEKEGKTMRMDGKEPEKKPTRQTGRGGLGNLDGDESRDHWVLVSGGQNNKRRLSQYVRVWDHGELDGLALTSSGRWTTWYLRRACLAAAIFGP